MKCPEEANPQRQKADWLSGAEGREQEWLLVGLGFPFGRTKGFWN